MAGLSDADQGRFPVPRLDSGGAAGARPGAAAGPGEAVIGTADHRHPRVAELLLQIADDAARALSRARFVHPVDEAEEHHAPPHGRGDDHPLGPGVLRLGSPAWAHIDRNGENSLRSKPGSSPVMSAAITCAVTGASMIPSR